MMRSAVLLGAIVAVWLNVACRQGDEPSAAAVSSGGASDAAPQETLSPVMLPDVSRLAASVQRQLRERYASLTTTLGNTGASPAERAAAYGEIGRLFLAAKFIDEAISCYAHAQALSAEDMRWPYYLGHAYLRKGDRARAARAFERASKLQPNDLNVLIWLGETYLDDGRADAARTVFLRAVSLQPQSAPALFGAGRAALARQSYAEAVQFMERALGADSRATAIHYPLAMAYRASGDREKAESHLRQRGSSFPELADPLMPQDDEVLKSAIVYEGRGVQALRDADWAAAETAFRRGLELEPRDPALRYWLGATRFAAGDAPGAEREFQAVLRQAPDYAKAHFSLGMIEESRGRHPAAIGHFRRAVQHDPKLPEARFRLADALRATGQMQSAFTHYDAAVKLDPGLAEAWIGGAQALIALGLEQKAIEWLAQARRLHPGRSELAGLQGRLTLSK